MAEVYIALGTNLGELQQNLREAISYLKAGVKIDKSSGVYETIPAYFENQGNFLNMVVGGTTALAPHELLAFLKQIENKMGRQPTERNGPRIIDLDILFYDNLILDTPDLVIPHPRIAEREFVLVPLAEIAAPLLHPTLHQTVQELLAIAPQLYGKVVSSGLKLNGGNSSVSL